MSDLYFEGTVTVDTIGAGTIKTATPVSIEDGQQRESFIVRLQSVSRTGYHPVMDQLAGKRVRIIFQELP